ncbi:MAG: acid shock protein [Alphaproteobacteria bacterium]|nr:acid shock protein [Alphaproteobacteria bacterium]
MEKVKLNRILALFVVNLGIAFSVSAQVFAPENSEQSAPSSVQTKALPVKNETDGWRKFYGNASAQNSQSVPVKSEARQSAPSQKFQSTQAQQMKVPAKQLVTDPQNYIYRNVPQIDRPTLDGVKRGRTSVAPVVPNSKVKAEGYIYLYYTDFSLRRMMSGSMSCDVKLQIVTTLDRRLNSLAVRLVWPHMQTPVTFIDVNPNQKYQMPYTLLGDGCYSMDKIPNIVVNRCRVKGMTQQECANRVRWMRKM